MAVITIDGLSKRFGDVLAVDDLSFSVQRGHVVGFLGPNGAGNTTTLRMPLGLVNPTAGRATIDGRGYGELEDPVHTVGALLDGGMLHPGRTGRNDLRAIARSGTSSTSPGSRRCSPSCSTSSRSPSSTATARSPRACWPSPTAAGWWRRS